MSDTLDRDGTDNSSIDWNEHAEYWDSFEEAIDYTKNIIQLVESQIDLNDKLILDFGCGTGLLTDYMAKKANHIVALDTADKMIEVLKNKGYDNVTTINKELNPNTIQTYPELQQPFDLIVAVSVCAFVPNYAETLSTIKSLLKPNGTYIQWDWLTTAKDPNFGFTKEQIIEEFSKAELKIDSISTPFHMMEGDTKMEVLMAVAGV